MSIKVQYSPDPSIVHHFSAGFMYHPENGGIGITSMNRLRRFTASLGVQRASKNLIFAILAHSGGEILGEAVNTYGHRSLICKVNIEKYKQTVFWALISGSIEGHITQEGITPEFTERIDPVMKSRRMPKVRNSTAYNPEKQRELEFVE